MSYVVRAQQRILAEKKRQKKHLKMSETKDDISSSSTSETEPFSDDISEDDDEPRDAWIDEESSQTAVAELIYDFKDDTVESLRIQKRALERAQTWQEKNKAFRGKKEDEFYREYRIGPPRWLRLKKTALETVLSKKIRSTMTPSERKFVDTVLSQ